MHRPSHRFARPRHSNLPNCNLVEAATCYLNSAHANSKFFIRRVGRRNARWQVHGCLASVFVEQSICKVASAWLFGMIFEQHGPCKVASALLMCISCEQGHRCNVANAWLICLTFEQPPALEKTLKSMCTIKEVHCKSMLIYFGAMQSTN